MDVTAAWDEARAAQDRAEQAVVDAYTHHDATLATLAEQTGRSVETIRQLLRSRGVTLRSRGAAGHRTGSAHGGQPGSGGAPSPV